MVNRTLPVGQLNSSQGHLLVDDLRSKGGRMRLGENGELPAELLNRSLVPQMEDNRTRHGRRHGVHREGRMEFEPFPRFTRKVTPTINSGNHI